MAHTHQKWDPLSFARPPYQSPSSTPSWVKWKKTDSPRVKRETAVSKEFVQDEAEKDMEVTIRPPFARHPHHAATCLSPHEHHLGVQANLAQAQQELAQQNGRVAAMAGAIGVPQDLVKRAQVLPLAARQAERFPPLQCSRCCVCIRAEATGNNLPCA